MTLPFTVRVLGRQGAVLNGRAYALMLAVGTAPPRGVARQDSQTGQENGSCNNAGCDLHVQASDETPACAI